jgi:hypothetical protein
MNESGMGAKTGLCKDFLVLEKSLAFILREVEITDGF